MKILGIINQTGGNYHRIQLPLLNSNTEIILVETITEDILKQYKPDIIYIHWNSPVSIPQLSIWQSKYKFKVVADIDDSWSGLFEEYNKTVFQSQHLCIFADGVICTNHFIRNQILEFNENCIIIPNYIPNNYGGDFKREYGEKIKIGIYGSIKGHYDNWISLRPIIKKLQNDKDIKDKIHFNICGIDEDKRWEKIFKLFPKNNTSLFWHTSPKESINLMKNIDILLCPLDNTNLSKGRSNLKIYEACCVGTIPVISEEYRKKNIYNFIFPGLNFDNIKELILFKEKYKNLTYTFMNTFNYQKDAVDKRLIFFKSVLSIKETKKRPEPEIYSITYSPEQIGEYKEFYNPIKTIKEKSYLFEYNPLIFLSDISKTKGYFGVLSYKFPMKTGFYKKMVLDILQNETADVVSFCKPIPNYLNWSEYQHPGILRILSFICDKLNLKYKEPKNTIYSNFFVAKGDIYKKYINEVLKPAIKLMEENEYLKDQVWLDSNYKSGLSSEELKKNTELNYYTFHTFVLERLMSIWLENNPSITITNYY